MANLAIKGHATRGREVIELLEMLGGINKYNLRGSEDEWFVLNGTLIQRSDRLFAEKGFPLEQFLEKYPYKVGDKVLDCDDNIHTITSMSWDGDFERVVYRIQDIDGIKSIDFWYANEMPYKEKTMEGKLISKEEMSLKIDTSQMEKRQIIFSADAPDETELVLGDNFEINVEDGKTYVVRKKPQYPKTYEECCMILQNACMTHKGGYKGDLIQLIQKLIICRDAYWKIAGEKMGLGKSWEPDWESFDLKYVIKTMEDEICKPTECTINCFLAFPTEEMRNKFYENFKELIEQCKKLL